MVGPLALMLDGRASALVSPAWQWSAEVGRENRVRDFVRQHRINGPRFGPLNSHLPAADFATVKRKAGITTGAEIIPDGCRQGTGLRPFRHRSSQPFDSQGLAVVLGSAANLFSELRRRCLDCEVRRLI